MWNWQISPIQSFDIQNTELLYIHVIPVCHLWYTEGGITINLTLIFFYIVFIRNALRVMSHGFSLKVLKYPLQHLADSLWFDGLSVCQEFCEACSIQILQEEWVIFLKTSFREPEKVYLYMHMQDIFSHALTSSKTPFYRLNYLMVIHVNVLIQHMFSCSTFIIGY